MTEMRGTAARPRARRCRPTPGCGRRSGAGCARWRGPGSGCSRRWSAFITLIVLFSVNQAGAWPAVLAGWLVVRVLAVLLLVQEVLAGFAVHAALRDGWRPSRWQWLALGGVLGGAGLLLVAAAYYGLFSLPW